MAAMILLLPGPAAAQTDSISLAEAIRLAQQVQPSAIQAQGDVRNASAQIRSAKGAFLPNLIASSSGGTSASGGPSRTSPVTGEIITGKSTNTSVSLGVSSSVDLFTGFRRGADLRAARAAGDAAAASLVDANYQVALLTTQSFLDALAAKDLLRVRRTSVERADEQLRISVAKLHAGTATRSDSLRSLVDLGTARLQLAQAETQMAQTEAVLGRLVGRDGRVAARDDSAFHQRLAPLDTAALLEEAQAKSPLVQSTAAQASAARASLASSRSAYWPTLSLSAGTNWNGSDGQNYQLFNTRQVNLTLSWAVFNRFTREQTIVSRQSALDGALATAADARRQVRSSMITAMAQVDAAALGIDISTTSVAAAEEDLRVVRERYRVGVATIVDVLTSQQALTQAEIDLVNARFDYLRAKAQIEALIGRPL
jgi:outer membrane protein